jgi:ABC-2 type transport system permease protein
MGILAAAYGLAAANHLRSEESAGHTEALLATTTTRTRWATSHYVAALAGLTVLMLLAGLSIGAGAALTLHDGSQVGRVTLAALAQTPAAWVITSVVLALFGWVPRLTAGAWGLFLAFIALGEFGVLWNAPQWLMDVSPFQHSPRLPVGSSGVTALAALTATAAILAGLGYLGWRRRDLTA